MASPNNSEIIKDLVEQYKKYNESNKKLSEMISSNKCQTEWTDNYHVIEHDWILKWKKINENIIQNNIQNLNIDKLNNQTIYYEDNNRYYVDPMKNFDIVTDDVWKLFDTDNNNSLFNGKVSILEGNGKIIIHFDEKNYLVKYPTNDQNNPFREFVVKFPSQCKDKENILKDLAENDIYKWMKEVKFESNLKEFTVEKYKQYETKFEIKQKTNNFLEEPLNITFNISQEKFNEVSKSISFSGESFSFRSSYVSSTSSNLISDAIIDYFSEIENFRHIRKINQTSYVSSIMRCLSFIEPFVDYFTGHYRSYVFSRFQSKGLLNLSKEYLNNLWGNEKEIYTPIDFMKYVREKANLNIDEEQDPIIFLRYIFEQANKRLNNIDINFQFDFNNIAKEFKGESLYNDLEKIIKNNNSIIAETFFGLMLETYKCNKCCKTFVKIKQFSIIDIEYREIIKFFNEAQGISCVGLGIDDFLDYYFLKKDLNTIPKSDEICPNCQENSKIINKEILVYPPYLIIRLNRGKFEEKKGFIENIDIDGININYKKIKYLKIFHSQLMKKKYNNIKFEYDLIAMVNYVKADKIKFISICKNMKTQKDWISFVCGARPKKLNEKFDNNVSLPYILFYKYKEKKDK